MVNLVNSADSAATSTSLITLSAAWKFSLAIVKLVIVVSRRLSAAPKVPRFLVTLDTAALIASSAKREADCEAISVAPVMEYV